MLYNDSPPQSSDDLTTSSRMRTWFMVQFKGYTVVQRREVPRVTRLGRLTYASLWQLRPPNGAKETGSPQKDGAKF